MRIRLRRPGGDRQKPDGVLEALAERHQTTMKTVFSALPEGRATPVAASRFGSPA